MPLADLSPFPNRNRRRPEQMRIGLIAESKPHGIFLYDEREFLANLRTDQLLFLLCGRSQDTGKAAGELPNSGHFSAILCHILVRAWVAEMFPRFVQVQECRRLENAPASRDARRRSLEIRAAQALLCDLSIGELRGTSAGSIRYPLPKDARKHAAHDERKYRPRTKEEVLRDLRHRTAAMLVLPRGTPRASSLTWPN